MEINKSNVNRVFQKVIRSASERTAKRIRLDDDNIAIEENNNNEENTDGMLEETTEGDFKLGVKSPTEAKEPALFNVFLSSLDSSAKRS